MKHIFLFILSVTLILTMSGCSSSENEITTSTVEAVITEIESNNETYQTDTSVTDTQNIEIKYDEQLTVEGTITLNESSFPTYCFKLDKDIAITLSDGDFSENFECDTLYFYDESDINGNYNYTKLENKKCTVTAYLENYRGGGELFLLNPIIMIDGAEAETNTDTTITENENIIKSRANGNWAHIINIAESQNLIIRSDGTFIMTYNAFGEVEEMITGNYVIVSDDGQCQEFCFMTLGNDNDIWYAKIYQTALYDEYGYQYDGIEYITADGEILYYTGVKYID